MSFGFYVREQRWSELADGTFKRTVLDLDLTECSLVTYPAYSATTVAMRSLEAFKAQAAPKAEIVEEQAFDMREVRLRQLEARVRLANRK